MRLVKTSTSPGFGACVGQNAARVNQASHRITELDFFFRNAMAAQNHTAGFMNLVRATFQNLLQFGHIAFARENHQRERCYRTTTHRVNIAQRVGCRNTAEKCTGRPQWE